MHAEAKTEESIILDFSTEWPPYTKTKKAPGTKLMSMHLINRYLVGVYLTDVHLIGVCLMGVCLSRSGQAESNLNSLCLSLYVRDAMYSSYTSILPVVMTRCCLYSR